MTHSFKDMTLDELQNLKHSLDLTIEDKLKQWNEEEDEQGLALNKAILDFIKKYKKVKIEASIPVVIEYDLSSMEEWEEYYDIKELGDMFETCYVYGSVCAGKGLKPKIKTFINDQLEGMELCPEAIKLFKPDLWKQMTEDFKEFLKLKELTGQKRPV